MTSSINPKLGRNSRVRQLGRGCHKPPAFGVIEEQSHGKGWVIAND